MPWVLPFPAKRRRSRKAIPNHRAHPVRRFATTITPPAAVRGATNAPTSMLKEAKAKPKAATLAEVGLGNVPNPLALVRVIRHAQAHPNPRESASSIRQELQIWS